MPDNIEDESLDSESNTKPTDSSDKIIPNEDTDTVNQNQKTEEMEVHHHANLHHKEKHLKEYFLEFLMIFIAVTLGFFAESYREHITDRSREKEYMRSLVEDLKKDTINYTATIEDNKMLINGYDSLINILRVSSTNKDTALLALKYYFGYLLSFDPMLVSDGTISQLKNNGGLRLLMKKNVAGEIISYYNIEKFLIEDQYIRMSNWGINMAENQASHVYNYFADIEQITDPSFGQKYSNPVGGNPAIITTDRSVITAFINNLIIYRGVTGTYIHNNVTLKERAEKLISLIQKEYKLQ